MAKATIRTNASLVNDYFKKLDHPLKQVVQLLRQVVLSTDHEIGEQIKWNSPAYYYTGEMKPFDPKEYKRDIVVFNLHNLNFILLVFPTGASIGDQTGILEGKFPDGRKTSKFSTAEEVNAKEKLLQAVIKKWLNLIEK